VSRPDDQQTDVNGFVRRTATESTCVFCHLSVRSWNPGLLKVAEDVHCQFSPANPRLFVQSEFKSATPTAMA
jgi:hypothetical protein